MSVKSKFVSLVYAFVATAFVNAATLSTPTTAETFTNLRGALDEVAARYQIRVGLECAPQDKDLQTISLDLSEKSVDTVLNQLVSQKTDYVWAVADNVYATFSRNQNSTVFWTCRYANLQLRLFPPKKH